MAKKITVPEVFKQDLEVLVYLLVYGLVAYLSEQYLQVGPLSLVLGGAADYLVYRLKTELNKKGYREALK